MQWKTQKNPFHITKPCVISLVYSFTLNTLFFSWIGGKLRKTCKKATKLSVQSLFSIPASMVVLRTTFWKLIKTTLNVTIIVYAIALFRSAICCGWNKSTFIFNKISGSLQVTMVGLKIHSSSTRWMENPLELPSKMKKPFAHCFEISKYVCDFTPNNFFFNWTIKSSLKVIRIVQGMS